MCEDGTCALCIELFCDNLETCVSSCMIHSPPTCSSCGTGPCSWPATECCGEWKEYNGRPKEMKEEGICFVFLVSTVIFIAASTTLLALWFEPISPANSCWTKDSLELPGSVSGSVWSVFYYKWEHCTSKGQRISASMFVSYGICVALMYISYIVTWVSDAGSAREWKDQRPDLGMQEYALLMSEMEEDEESGVRPVTAQVQAQTQTQIPASTLVARSPSRRPVSNNDPPQPAPIGSIAPPPDSNLARPEAETMTTPAQAANATVASTAPKWCKKCDYEKPARVHHCTVCQRCISRMDHHCTYVGNCIGSNNHKTFILFILYTVLASTQGVFVILRYFVHSRQAYRVKGVVIKMRALRVVFLSTALPLSLLIQIICSISVGFLLYYSLGLLLRNETTVENYQRQYPNRYGQVPVYHRGVLSNIQSVFGSGWRFWMLWWAPILFKRNLRAKNR